MGSTPPYQQTISLAGIVETDTPFYDIDLSGVSEYDDMVGIADNWAKILRIKSGDGEIVVYATGETDVEIPIIVKVVR